MEVIHPRCCGIDIHKESVVACLRLQEGRRVKTEGRRFGTPEARNTFEAALERFRQQYGLCVYGYVVMPEHVHLLVSETERGTLSQATQSLKQGGDRKSGVEGKRGGL